MTDTPKIPPPGTADWWVHLLNHSLLYIPHPDGRRVRSTSFRGDLIEFIKKQAAEIERLRQWISDLQAGGYVNCVYCGHRYGPAENTPVSLANILKEHIQMCPEHPMSELREINHQQAAEIAKRDEILKHYGVTEVL